MRFTELALPGVFLIEPMVHEDGRGSFRRHFCTAEFAAHGLAPAMLQGNVSENVHDGTLRGLHYQIGGCAEAKTLSCLTGAAYDIVVDLRRDSPTFLRWVSAQFSAADRRSLHVPAGCANGWITLAPHTMIHYYMSEMFAPAAARGIRYNAPFFKFNWPREPLVVADKDRAFPLFDPESTDGF